MTTVACWFNQEEETRLWICSDGKLSTNQTTLVESAAKIFSVPIQCYGPDAIGGFEKQVYASKIAMSYAGSSLVGLNVHAALSACLSRLNTVDNSPPSLEEIAHFALKLLQTYISQLSVSAGRRAFAEIVLAGYCPVENDFLFFHIKPVIADSEWSCKMYYHSSRSTPKEKVLVIGSHADKIQSRIDEIRREQEGIWWWRAPIDAVGEEIHESNSDEIGGHIQMGIGGRAGFELYSVLDHSKSGPAAMSYLGFNVFREFHQIGNCFVGMRCMSIFSTSRKKSNSA